MEQDRVRRALPPAVHRLLSALESSGYEAYAVGGCVRDALMGVEPHDWDICTSALPVQIEAVFSSYRLIETGLKHGTVTVLVDHEPFEITTFRTEADYSDHRRPDAVSFVTSLEQDLARRDFTINAMAWGLDSGLIDLYGGQEDLAQGLIRCVGDPNQRFFEDGLRILRALRFAARLGFAIEADTARAIHENKGLLSYISGERIFSELKGLLVGKRAACVLQEFSDVPAQCLPALCETTCHDPDLWRMMCRRIDLTPADALLRLTLLLEAAGQKKTDYQENHECPALLTGTKDSLNRLKCDNITRRTVLELLELSKISIPTDRIALRHLISRWGPERIRQALTLSFARAEAAEDKAQAVRQEAAQRGLEHLLANETCFSISDLAVGGKDLIALGIPRGKQVGAVLQALLDQVLDEKLPNKAEALLSRARSDLDSQREETGHA